MLQSRDALYQIKKKAEGRSSPFYNPADRQEQIRKQLKDLRNKNRAQQTQIIRLNHQIQDLRRKVLFYQEQIKDKDTNQEVQKAEIVKKVSHIPIIIENKQLKEQIEHTQEISLSLNGRNRELEAQNRQLNSDLKRLSKKLKEFQILENVRSQQFQAELQNSKPVIIEDSEQVQVLSQGLKKVLEFVRAHLVIVAEQIFVRSADQCQEFKKTNSYNIFIQYWNELRQSKRLGYQALVQSFKSLKQLETVIRFPKCQVFDINDSKYRDTLNQWVINTLTEIKHMKQGKGKMKEQKLFRLLGLLYRSKFPIQGEVYKLQQDVRNHFEDLLAQEISLMI